jgi:putative Flp pilus-assembly TadE/G-like protein
VRKSLIRDQKGNIIAVVGLGLPLLIASAGLAVDTIQWTLAKRQAQSAADGAAIAAVHALIQGVDAESEVVDHLGRNDELPPDTAMKVVTPPAEHADDPFAVSVRLTIPARTSFSSMFLSEPFTITAEATATVVESGEFCAFAIGGGDKPGLIIERGSSVEMDCGIATNSSSPQAIKADSSSSVAASRVVSYGGADSGGALKGSPVRTHGLRQEDPYADTEPPLVPSSGCPNVTVNADSAREVVLQPGCYGNIVVNGQARLAAGEYVLNRGNLIVGPTGKIACNGCSLFLTSQDAAVDPRSVGKVRIHEHATVDMSAPKSGPNEGILIYQDRRAANDAKDYENRIGGSSFSKLEGLLYFPSDTVRLDARMAPDLQCARLIGKRLIIDGRVVIAKDCGASGKLNFAGLEVRLVQ